MKKHDHSCDTCTHYAPLAKQCRAHSPVPHPVSDARGCIVVLGLWPAVDAEHWCSEWLHEGLDD